MNRDDFSAMVDKTFAEVQRLNQQKGEEYAGSADVLANFRRHAANLQLTQEQIWSVYAGKHWDAVVSYCSKGRTFSEETVQSRATDLILYLLLLIAMTEEKTEAAAS